MATVSSAAQTRDAAIRQSMLDLAEEKSRSALDYNQQIRPIEKKIANLNSQLENATGKDQEIMQSRLECYNSMFIALSKAKADKMETINQKLDSLKQELVMISEQVGCSGKQ